MKFLKSHQTVIQCELDPIPAKLISDSVLDILTPGITLVVTLSFASGMFPGSLKESLLHPRLKKILLDMDICLRTTDQYPTFIIHFATAECDTAP